MTLGFFCAIITTSKFNLLRPMKNLIISTFLILSTLATGLMSYQPGEITNLLGAVQTSAQLKDTKRCDAATAGFYGEFVVTSANVSVVERDGKAGVPLPQNILLEAIKYSGLYRDMFLANTSADKIIATAVAERACVISPINYVSVVTMDASDKQYYSPTFLTYCGLGFTTIGNTFTKINGTQTADTLGYGAFLTSQCKPIPLVCKEGEIKTVVDGKEVCQPRPVDCKQYYYKPAGTTTCVPVVCLAPATFVEDKGCVTPPQVCPTTAPGTYPNCVVPPLVCTPPAVLNATKNGCDTTVTTVVCTPPAVINATKTACEIPATPVVCTAPAVLNPTTKVCETPAAPVEKKKGSMLPLILGGAALLGGLFFLTRKKTPPPGGSTPPPSTPPGTPPSVVTSTLVCPSNNSIVKNLTQESANGVMTRSTASLPAGTIIKVTQGTDAQVLAEYSRISRSNLGTTTNRPANRTNVTLPTRTSNGTPTNFSKKTNVTVPTNANRTASTNANRLNSATVTNARVSGSNTNRTANVTTATYSVICVKPRTRPNTNVPATCPSPSNGGLKALDEWLKSKNGKVTPAEYNAYVNSKIKDWEKQYSITNLKAKAGCTISYDKKPTNTPTR